MLPAWDVWSILTPHPNNLQNQNRQGTHTTTQLVRDVHSAHKHASNLRGARFANKYLRISNVIYPGPPAVVRFIIWLHSSLARGTAASHWISKHITKCCRRLLTKPSHDSTFKSHLTLVPWHTRTMSISLSYTQLQAIVYCHLCLSVVLTPQAFAPASGLLGLCHQL